MKIKNLIYLFTIGVLGFMTSCDKDETRVVMSENPIAPTIKTMSDLTFVRTEGTNTLTFVGTSVDPGFTASATYVLEACTSGDNFANPISIFSGTQDTLIEITVTDFNSLLLKTLDADATYSLDLRIRATLVVDAGTGALGTSSNPLEYSSEVKTVSVTTYGLPRLNVMHNGEIIGKVESALGDGNYSGYVKMDTEKPFTLKDPDTGTEYGLTGSVLTVDGNAITADASGWYYLTVDTKTPSYSASAYMIGLVGTATVNDWNSPDTKMDYNSKEDCWYITTDLDDGQFKFRLNDGWASNWGGKGTSDGSADNYTDDTTVPLAAGGKNISLNYGAGNYTIKFYINDLKATVVKN